MPTAYQIINQDKAHYLTLQVVEWVDIFTRQTYRDIMVRSLNYCIQNKNLIVLGYVIMSNHIHLIASSECGRLSDTIRDLKGFTSKEILKEINSIPESRASWMMRIFKESTLSHKRNTGFQFWTHENHALEIYSQAFFESKLDYVHNNPVRAGLVERAEEYIYSSAKNYAGEKGLVDVLVQSRRWKTVE